MPYPLLPPSPLTGSGLSATASASGAGATSFTWRIRRRATTAAAGGGTASFTASYTAPSGAPVSGLLVGSGATSVAVRVRRRSTGALTGAGATSFTANSSTASSIRAIMQPAGAAAVLFTARLQDVTAPIISGVTATGIQSTRAGIFWLTDEPTVADEVEYNTTGPAPGGTTLSATGSFGTSHFYTIGATTPLTPNVTYYYRVKSTDARGNQRVSGFYSFLTVPAEPTHRFYVDWDGDGNWGDAYEEVTADVLFMEGVQASRGRDQIRQLAPPAAGAFDATLNNRHRRYSPANAESPLVGLLEPGRLVKWQVEYAPPGGSYAIYDLFTGPLDNLPQQPTFGRQSVRIPSLGTLSRLRGIKVTTAVYANIRTDQALHALLDAAGWVFNDRVIATGATTLDWWWLDDEDAFSAMIALLSMEGPGAAIYEDGRGYIVFEGRTYRLLQPRCTEVQAVFTDTGPEPWRSPDLTYEPGLKDVVNACSVEVNVRAAGSTQVIWSLGQTVTLGNGETKGYTIRPSDPFQSAVTPVAGTDFVVASGSVTAVSLTRTSGGTTAIFLTAGAGGASVTGLQLRAQPIAITNRVTLEENKTDPATVASVSLRGTRNYPLPLRHEINPEVARDFCNVVVQRYRDPRPQVTITVPCVTPLTTVACLSRQISDRIAVQDQGTGISMPMHIEQIRWEWREGVLYAIFGCEQASSESYALWGSAIWDTSLWAF